MTIEEKDFFFGQVVLLDDVIISISKNELHYFDGYLCHQQITKNPLIWWAQHEMEFLHVFFWLIKCLAL
jgi:uncharacterized CHY-type Zn-finger protein